MEHGHYLAMVDGVSGVILPETFLNCVTEI